MPEERADIPEQRQQRIARLVRESGSALTLSFVEPCAVRTIGRYEFAGRVAR